MPQCRRCSTGLVVGPRSGESVVCLPGRCSAVGAVGVRLVVDRGRRSEPLKPLNGATELTLTVLQPVTSFFLLQPPASRQRRQVAIFDGPWQRAALF